ncbi:MAG: sterol desaturase family protein [Bacteroidetes bacterium]|nr:sterol desaturase family protein [Bacteroidota bacterium]
MEPIMVYFESIPSRDRSLILAGGIAFFWLIETAFPLFRFSYKKWKHAGINLFFTLTTIVVNFALAFLLLQTSRWTQANHWGLLSFIDNIPLIGYAIIGLMGLDLISAYFIHWLEHKVRFMWRFHLIHHTDIHVDTTTANRHHPGESVFRFVFTTLGVFILGAPVWLIMLYQALSVVLSQFNHANISLPERLDKWLSLAIVTPNMHHVHHHYILPQTDSNYGNIFSIWDRIFGTYSYMNQSDIQYGIDTHLEKHEHSNVSKMLKIPFEPYRTPVGGKFTTPEK